MFLSDAILLGSTMSKQAFGPDIGDGRCVLEAGLDGIGEHVGLDFDYMVIRQKWAYVINTEKCPICGSLNDNVLSVLWHLNDQHEWTRPRIADWLRKSGHEQYQGPQPMMSIDDLMISHCLEPLEVAE